MKKVIVKNNLVDWSDSEVSKKAHTRTHTHFTCIINTDVIALFERAAEKQHVELGCVRQHHRVAWRRCDRHFLFPS